MTHLEKINYMRISAGICGYKFSNEQLDLLISLYDLILSKEGETNIKDVVRIESEVKERAEKHDNPES
jgi:hypothetical protein